MSDAEEDFETYTLDSRCVVPWSDGSMYCGRVQKILDPQREVLIEGIPSRKQGKREWIENTTAFDKLRKDRTKRVPLHVLDDCIESGETWFNLHYFGWGPSYDEWLPLQRMLPYTSRNIAEMKAVNAELKEKERKAKEAELKAKEEAKKSKEPTKAKRGRSAEPETPKAKTPAPVKAENAEVHRKTASNHKRRRVVLDDERGFEIRLALPLDFKRLLVEDWKLVTRDRAIVDLPRSVSVVEILKDFAEEAKPASSGETENLDLFVRSMVTYFDYALGMMLLYRFERNAYYYQRKNDAHFRPSLLYGAEHLSRLIVSMPTLLSQLPLMDDISMKYIVQQLEALAEFMIKHRGRYFSTEASYAAATRAYSAMSVPNTESALPEPN